MTTIGMQNLAQVEIQLIYQYLNLRSFLKLARCCKRLLDDASSKISLKYLPQLNIIKSPINSEFNFSIIFKNLMQCFNIKKTNPLLLSYHSKLGIYGNLEDANRIVQELQKLVKYCTVNNQKISRKNIDTIIKFIPTLTYLNLSYNVIDITIGGVVAIAEALKVNCKLTCLNLSYTNIADSGGVAIAEVLKVNCTLMTLNLSYSYIGVCGAVAIADALKVHHTLTSLNLSNNYRITAAGGVALAKAIKVNNTLTTLNIANTAIINVVAVIIAEAIKVNHTLTSLNLGYNEIWDAGGMAIAEAIKVNCTLTFLNLSSNFIGDDCKIAIYEAIKINNTLTSLDLSEQMLQ